MDQAIHIAITRRVRKAHTFEFERALADFARRSLAEPGARGVHLLYPPPGSGSAVYGILRSFASARDRDRFYESVLYRDWLDTIRPMVEGEANYRQLSGLEAWFRDPRDGPPPRWKMALLTFLAVWPISVYLPQAILPLLGAAFPQPLAAGLIAAGIVAILTWVVMPIVVRLVHPWLLPKPPAPGMPCPASSNTRERV